MSESENVPQTANSIETTTEVISEVQDESQNAAQIVSDFWNKKDAEVLDKPEEKPTEAPKESVAVEQKLAITNSERFLAQRAQKAEKEAERWRQEYESKKDLIAEAEDLRAHRDDPFHLLKYGNHTIQSLSERLLKDGSPKEKDKAEIALERIDQLEKEKKAQEEAVEREILQEQAAKKEAEVIDYVGKQIIAAEEKYPILASNLERTKNWVTAVAKSYFDQKKPISLDDAMEIVNKDLATMFDTYQKYKESKRVDTKSESKPVKPKSVTISRELVEPAKPERENVSEEEAFDNAIRFGQSIKW